MHPSSAHRMQYRLTLAFALSLLMLTAAARAQTPAAPAASAAPTQLLAGVLTMPLDASRAKVGTKFQANATADWSGYGCNLRVGAVIDGHVSQVERHSKASPRSSLVLVLDSAECNRKKGTPFKASIIALLGPPDAPSGMGKGVPLTDVPNQISRSVEGAAQANPTFTVEHSIPSVWKPGMVVDVPMGLTVGAGPADGSTVWTTGTDARLEGKTTFIISVTQP